MFKSILLFGFVFSFAPMLILGQSKQENTQAEARTDSMTFSVKGMTCMGCVSHVKGTMDKVDGITQCDVSLKEGMANIKYDPAKTDEKKIEQALKSTGYTISEIKKKEEKETEDKRK